jgi:hypothetical protein
MQRQRHQPGGGPGPARSGPRQSRYANRQKYRYYHAVQQMHGPARRKSAILILEKVQ